MGIFAPVTFAFKTFSTAGNVYLAGQISWWVYREVRKMQKETIQASKLRENFIEHFTRQYERSPTEEEIGVAMQAYDAVVNPIKHRFSVAKDKGVKVVLATKDKGVKVVKTTKKQVQSGVRDFFEWKERGERIWYNTEQVHTDSRDSSED